MKHFTCQEGEVCRAGDGEVGRCDIQGFHSVHGHFVEVRRVHIAVVIPPESVEGDQQHLLSRFVCRRREDGRGQEEAEAGGPQHGAHRRCVRCQLTRSWSRSNLLASHLPRQSSRAKFPPQLILSRSSDRRYLSALSHAALMMFMSWFFTAGSCVHSEFPPVFCSWVPAVKQINLPEHRGCLSPPQLACWCCLSVCLPRPVCVSEFPVNHRQWGNDTLMAFTLSWDGAWLIWHRENEEENESIYLFVSWQWSLGGRKDPNGRIHCNNSNVCISLGILLKKLDIDFRSNCLDDGQTIRNVQCTPSSVFQLRSHSCLLILIIYITALWCNLINVHRIARHANSSNSLFIVCVLGGGSRELSNLYGDKG